MNRSGTIPTFGQQAARLLRKLPSVVLDFAALRIPPLDAWRRRAAGNYRQRGLDAYGQADYEHAWTYLDIARKLVPRDPEIYCDLGLVHYSRGRYEDAERFFRKALNQSFSHPRALEWMGYTLRARGNFAEAVYFFLRCLEQNPKNGTVLLNLGSCLHDSGKYNEAIAYYKKAEEVDPHNPLIMENRALAYYSLGQVDQAIEHIRRSLILDPTNSRAQTFLGRALETNGDKEEAIRSYKRAIELDPMNADARLNASFLLDQSGAYEEAAQYARQAIEAYQQKGQKNGVALGYLDLGWYYYRMGRIDESEQASRKSLEIDPSLYGARFNLALAHLRQGRVDEARKEYLEGADSVKLASDLKTWAIDDLNAALQDHSLPGGAEILDELKARYKALRSRRGLDNLPYSPPSPHLKASSTS